MDAHTVTVCSSNFGRPSSFGSVTYTYRDAVDWDEAEDAFKVKMFGQMKGNSETILDEFNDPSKIGIFINAGKRMDVGRGGMEKGFMGKITSATREKDRDALGPAEFTLIVKRLIPIETVSIPASNKERFCCRKWGSVCRALGVSHKKISGRAHHGIFKAKMDISTDKWDRISRRLSRQ